MSKSRRQQKKQTRTTSRWLWLGLALIVVVIAAGAFVLLQDNTDEVAAPTDLPAEVSVAEAANLRDDGAFILDVREPDEWNAFHIPDATLIPLGELASRVDEVPRDEPVVVVCRSGNRSATGRDILKEAGFEQVTSMDGGVTEWQAEGLPIATGP